ncbi:MAG: Uma2 family endonuclease, partial [Aggregatilineales bacterium]
IDLFWMKYAYKPYEFIDGKVVALKKLSFQQSIIALRLTTLLQEFVETHDLGEALGANSGFALSANLLRSPRAAFISKSRWESIQYPYNYYPFAPDISVEITSKDTHRKWLLYTAAAYIRAGAQQVWCLHPDTREIAVYKAGGTYRILKASHTLTGGDILPGLEIRVDSLLPTSKKR